MLTNSLPRLLVCIFILARAAAALADAPATRPAAAPPSFAGEWLTTYGPMSLRQTGDAISGTYGGASDNTLTGTLANGKFSFTYTEPTARGEGWFVLSPDGQRFAGKWRENGGNAWLDWAGQRKSSAPDNFTGLWKTTFGKMRLHQTGNTVTGIYDFNGQAKISGTLEGKSFKFTYEQADGEKGEGQFELSQDAQNFSGVWKGGRAGQSGGGQWTASRILPQTGRIWLVVLEANWERDLEEEEYSFGVMLRTFFARVPAVKVRHRFFGNAEEFQKWCAELPYLAEPVYLHISSHGDKDGIHTGGKIIDAKILANCLREIGDLRLLHFGTCLVAGGDIPKQLYAELGKTAQFPISGYANVADWAGSAVIDFTYFDLIFSRNMKPREAYDQTLKMLSFAGAAHKQGDSISPAGLVFIAPPAAPATAPAK